jgi:periplasmic protein TonB
MMRILSFGGSAALHAGALGVLLWAGVLGVSYERPVASVAPSRPVSFDVHRDDPSPVSFESDSRPDSLPLAEAELEFEADPPVEELDTAVPLVVVPDQPAPNLNRPLRTNVRAPTAAADPTPLVESEIAPLLILNPTPSYPPAARRRSLEGHVLVEIRILKDGSVADPVIVESVGSPLFADEVLKVIAAWRYQPASLGGVPVERVQRVRFLFKITS